MTYDPTKWNHEDVITSQKLNKIEKGLTDVAESAIFGFGGAQQSSDGLTPFSYINAGDPMPSNPKKGDTVFIKDGNDFTIYSYDGEQWNIKVDPNLSQRLSDTLKEAKDSTDKAIADNNDQINNTIDEVAKEKIDLAFKDADFNEKAQAMADKALADAKVETVQAAQEALNSANQHLNEAKKDLMESVEHEASERNQAVAAVNSQAQNYVNQAKSDINDTINALSVGGRNLLLGTANGVTGIGSNSINDVFGRYSLAGGKKVSDLYNQYGSSGYLTISFDWVATGSTISGTFIPQWIGDPWGGLADSDIKVSSTNSSGHYEHTVALSADGYSTSWASAIRFRQDYLQGNITISNLKLESGNKATDWTPAPEDVVLDYTTKDNKIKETITQYQDTNDGKVRKAQTDATTALGLVETKVSQTDYDKKTGDLSTKVNEAKDTADKSLRTIGDYKTSNDKRVEAAESSIERTANAITEKVSKTDYDKKTGELTHDLSELKHTAEGFEATVTKVDNLSVGSRNLYLNSRGLADGYGINGNAKVTVEPFDSTTNMWHIVAAQGNGDYIGIYLWNYCKGKIPDDSDWSYSADVKGTGKAVTFGIERDSNKPVKGNIRSEWSRISQTGHVDYGVKTLVMYFDTTDSPLDVYIKLPKLETGNIPTDWTPDPEDTATALAQVKHTADSVSSIVSDPTKGLSVRVQTAEGTLNTVKSTADGAMSKASQTANDITQEIKDRDKGDSNTLQSSKDFTQSSITSAVNGANSTITQTSDSLIAKINTKTNSDTVLSLLKDNWSIGITDNISKITSGIVGNASQMSLISKNVTIDSPNTQIKGTAWIDSAMIQNGSIVNANIADAAITSAKIATLDVAKLTGNVSSFIQSNWNGVYGSTYITADGMSVSSGTVTTSFGAQGMRITMASNGGVVIQGSTRSNGTQTGVLIGMNVGSTFTSFGFQSSTDYLYNDEMVILKTGSAAAGDYNIGGGVAFNHNVSLMDNVFIKNGKGFFLEWGKSGKALFMATINSGIPALITTAGAGIAFGSRGQLYAIHNWKWYEYGSSLSGSVSLDYNLVTGTKT